MIQAFSALILAFSALLATPGFVTNVDVQNQALALIPQIQTIGAQIQTISDQLATTTPIQNIGSATQPEINTVAVSVGVAGNGVNGTPAPSCSLKVTPDAGDNPRSALIEWDSSNTTSNTGQVTIGIYFGCGDSCSEYKMVAPQGDGSISGSSGSKEVVFNWVNFDYPNNSLNHDNNTKVELNIGGATCDDYVPAK